MADLPSGTVTFIFTDIEGSTALLRRLGDTRYQQVHKDHHNIVRTSILAHKGSEVDAQSESFFVSFPSARNALNCAIAIQRAVAAHQWPGGVTLGVRIGIHTGEAELAGTGYIGMDVHRAARICQVGYGGQILMSQTTRSLVERDTPPSVSVRDLGSHLLKDMPQPERIFQVVFPDLPSEFPPLRSASAFPNNLPVLLTSFIGREREISEIKALLDKNRLVTLTGPGGCGKTRLALKVAANLSDQFPDGIWFMDLATISDPALVSQQASATLGMLAEQGRTTLNAVVEHLRHRMALLIFDTCEHLLPACAELVTALLRMTPGTKVLTTSREFLAIPGEVVYIVPSLSLPDGADNQSLESLKTSEAVRLFVDRATAASGIFSLNPGVAPFLIQIVRRLDGIPLAIELAAAKAKVLSVEEIADRLNDRFRLLTGGARTVLPRQQTLRAAVDWSYELLSERERKLLRRIAVFSGGCELEAVEGVCGGDDIQKAHVLDLLIALIDKSLVVVDHLGQRARYRLLDTIHEYCKEKLGAAGETDEFRTKHRDWFLGFAKEPEPRPPGLNDRRLDRIESDHDNLRAALSWSLNCGEAEPALAIALGLIRFWQVRGYWTEGRRWFVAARTMGQRVPSALQAKSLIAEGRLALHQGEDKLVEELGEQSLALARQLDDLGIIGQAIHLLGSVAYYRDDYETARTRFEESLEFARRISGGELIASCLFNLATIALHQEQYDHARRLAQESLDAFRRIGERRGTAFVLNLLGVVEADLGNPATAEPLLEESLRLGQEMGDRQSIAASLSHLGRVARDLGDYSRSEALYKQSLAVRREVADPRGIAISLAGLGIAVGLSGRVSEGRRFLEDSIRIRLDRGDRVSVAECLEGLARVTNDAREAAVFIGAAAAIRHGAKTRQPPAERGFQEQRVAELRRNLGEAQFEAARSFGETEGLNVVALRLGSRQTS